MSCHKLLPLSAVLKGKNQFLRILLPGFSACCWPVDMRGEGDLSRASQLSKELVGVGKKLWCRNCVVLIYLSLGMTSLSTELAYYQATAARTMSLAATQCKVAKNIHPISFQSYVHQYATSAQTKARPVITLSATAASSLCTRSKRSSRCSSKQAQLQHKQRSSKKW